MKDRDYDTSTLFLNSASSQPVGSIRFNRAAKTFEEWNGTAWVVLVLAVTGGGTGANTPASIILNLGLGTMSYQNSNAVNISGGSLYNLTYFTVSCSIVPQANVAYDLGAANIQWRNAYFGIGLAIPVGVDHYIVG